MLEAIFNDMTETITLSGLYQYDQGRKLSIKGINLDEVSEVHFSYFQEKEAIVTPAVKEGDAVICTVPDEVLTKPVDVYAWVYDVYADGARTKKTIVLKVQRRQRPNNFVDHVPSAEIVLEDVIRKINQNVQDNERFKEEVIMLIGDGFIDDSQLSIGSVWSSQKTYDSYKVDNVKMDYTIPSESYIQVAEPTLKKKFYADVTCTKSKVTMNCQISPADEVEDVSLLTYAEPLEGSVRCYFMDKPVAPYIIESIEFTNVIQSEELQTQTVYEQEMATYAIWKEQHDKEVAQAQQAIAEEKAREEAQKEQRLATMEYNIRNVEQASAGTAETVSLMQPKVRFMALDKVDSIVSGYANGSEPMPIDIMDIAEPEEWKPNETYKKGDLFVYEGKGGFAKQDVSSLDIYKPFTTGTESLYGARPKAVNGVYPYVYNMTIEIGMIVEDKGIKYRAIQNANELLYEPSAVPAILEVIEDAN